MASPAFAFQDVELRIRLVNGGAGKAYTCRGFSQKTTRESTNIHVNSPQPYEYSRGPKNHEGSLTLLQSTILEIERDYPTIEDLTDLHFDVTISFVNATNPDFMSVKVWENCSITEMEMSMGVDDPFMEVELPIRIGRINTVV